MVWSQVDSLTKPNSSFDICVMARHVAQRLDLYSLTKKPNLVQMRPGICDFEVRGTLVKPTAVEDVIYLIENGLYQMQLPRGLLQIKNNCTIKMQNYIELRIKVEILQKKQTMSMNYQSYITRTYAAFYNLKSLKM